MWDHMHRGVASAMSEEQRKGWGLLGEGESPLMCYERKLICTCGVREMLVSSDWLYLAANLTLKS
jgi:hypothetical protein